MNVTQNIIHVPGKVYCNRGHIDHLYNHHHTWNCRECLEEKITSPVFSMCPICKKLRNAQGLIRQHLPNVHYEWCKSKFPNDDGIISFTSLTQEVVEKHFIIGDSIDKCKEELERFKRLCTDLQQENATLKTRLEQISHVPVIAINNVLNTTETIRSMARLVTDSLEERLHGQITEKSLDATYLFEPNEVLEWIEEDLTQRMPEVFLSEQEVQDVLDSMENQDSNALEMPSQRISIQETRSKKQKIDRKEQKSRKRGRPKGSITPIQKLLNTYKKSKIISRTLSERLTTIVTRLLEEDNITEIFQLLVRLQSGEERVLRFISDVSQHLSNKSKKKLNEQILMDSTASVSEVLQQKDLLVISDKIWNELHTNLSFTTDNIRKIKIHRKGFNIRAVNAFQICSTPQGYKVSLKLVIEFLVRKAELSGKIPKDGVFKFKITMDGRPCAGGQVGIMIQCLNCEIYENQDPRNVIYIALWQGSELTDQVHQNCAGLPQELQDLEQHGISIGTNSGKISDVSGKQIDKYVIDFLWISDWKSWSQVVNIDKHEFCPFCHLKRAANIFGARSHKRTSITHFFGQQPNKTGLCSLHAIQRITEAQITNIYHSMSDRMSPDEFSAYFSEHFIPRFSLLQKDKEGIYERYRARQLTGDECKLILEKLDELFNDQIIRMSSHEKEIWKNWKIIYSVLNLSQAEVIKQLLTDSVRYQFQTVINDWAKMSHLRSGRYKYYHHFIEAHLIELIEDLISNHDLTLQDICQQGLENSHSLHKLYQLRGTSNNGGRHHRSRECQLLERQFRLLLLQYEHQMLIHHLKSYGIPSHENTITLNSFSNLDFKRFGWDPEASTFIFEDTQMTAVQFELSTSRAQHFTTFTRRSNKKKKQKVDIDPTVVINNIQEQFIRIEERKAATAVLSARISQSINPISTIIPQQPSQVIQEPYNIMLFAQQQQRVQQQQVQRQQEQQQLSIKQPRQMQQVPQQRLNMFDIFSSNLKTS
jgi:hypothetical protein